jgi:hypothetical protein
MNQHIIKVITVTAWVLLLALMCINAPVKAEPLPEGEVTFGEVVEVKQGGVRLQKSENTRMDVWKIYNEVVEHYEYVYDDPKNDTWDLYDARYSFKGDCEDFAFSLQRLIGAGVVMSAMSHESANPSFTPDHAVFVYAGMVWELNGHAVNIARYQAKYAQILWHRGDLTPEMKQGSDNSKY